MNSKECIGELNLALKFFETSTSVLEEADAGFRPTPAQFSVAEQVAHAAQTVDWFFAGAFGQGFDHDFKRAEEQVRKVSSLEAAREWLRSSIQKACQLLEMKSDSDLAAPLKQGDIMGGRPKFSIIAAIVDHTAHHRGALTVYARMLGKVPKMPYAE